MSDWKEVWHVWDGEGEAPKDAIKAVNSCGVTGVEGIHPSWWVNIEGDILNFSAYTTGQMRRRVECDECKDSKYKGLVYCGGYFEYRKCPSCNGKGMVWEYKDNE